MDIANFLFIALCFCASLISAVFGFGTALIVLAVGSHLLPVKECIALATVLFATSTVFKTVLFSRYIDWKLAAIMAFCSLPFSYLGAQLLNEVSADLLRQALGLMIIAYLCATQFKWLATFNPGLPILVTGSAIYGFISGLLGSGNLVKVIIFRQMSIKKEAFVGAMAATSVFSNIAKLTAYTQNGQLNASQSTTILCLVCTALAAVIIGRKALKKVTTLVFDRGVTVVLSVSAIALLI